MDLNKTMIIDDYKCIIRNDYLQEMNDKILNRRFPDMELQPNLDERPISTKYSLFPIANFFASFLDRSSCPFSFLLKSFQNF